MSDTQGGPSATTGPAPAADLARRRRVRRRTLGAIARVASATVVVFTLYGLAPLGERPEGAVLIELILALLVLTVVLAFQIFSVMRSPYPGLRALEAVAVSIPLFLCVFASTYVVMSSSDAASFTEPLDRIEAMYFTVTTFATVGFGDITAESQAAMIVVTVQMVADLVLIGLIAKVLFGAVQERRRSLAASVDVGSDTADPTPKRNDP